jgi:fatty acid desaturase
MAAVARSHTSFARVAPDASWSDVGCPRSEELRLAYIHLRHDVRRAGLLDRAYGYYALVAARSLVMLGAALALVVALPPTAPNLVLESVLLGFAFGQVALLGHDAGHLSVFRHARANWWLGELCFGFVTGIGFAHWRHDHNLHHGRPNLTGSDPALETGGLLAFTEEQARSRRGWATLITRYQAATYVIGVSLLAFTFQINGWRYALGRLHGRPRLAEVLILAAGRFAFAAPFLMLGPRWAVVWIGAQLLGGAYQGLIVAPNHKGMPVLDTSEGLSFVEQQMMTTRNVRPGRIADFVFGGLNYQLEHHLFPTMPRCRLGRARGLVQEFCRAQRLPYDERSAVDSYWTVLTEFNRIGRLAGHRAPLT